MIVRGKQGARADFIGQVFGSGPGDGKPIKVAVPR